jgi:hypothetical protein
MRTNSSALRRSKSVQTPVAPSDLPPAPALRAAYLMRRGVPPDLAAIVAELAFASREVRS